MNGVIIFNIIESVSTTSLCVHFSTDMTIYMQWFTETRGTAFKR